MCGICGIVQTTPGTSTDIEIAEQMSKAMSHRGPDGFGHFAHGPCALGHRRLSIIDISGGAQPMTDNSGQRPLTIVFNGEIYNFRELRSRLIQKGFFFFLQIRHGSDPQGVPPMGRRAM